MDWFSTYCNSRAGVVRTYKECFPTYEKGGKGQPYRKTTWKVLHKHENLTG